MKIVSRERFSKPSI